MCPKVTAEHKTEIRERIVEAAVHVFAKHGFDRARMDDIAEAADLSKGTLYLYFKNKEDLFDAICEQSVDALKDQLSKLFNSKESLIPDAKIFYENFRKIAHDNEVVSFEMLAESSRSKKLKQSLHETKMRTYQVVVDSLKLQMEKGIIKKDTDVNALAVGLVALYDGLTLSKFIGISDNKTKNAWMETIRALVNGIS